MSILRGTLIIASLVATSGCYRFVPVRQGDAPPGVKIKAQLTDAGADEMRRYFGPDILSVQGPLVAWDSEGLAFVREVSVRREGFPATRSVDTLRLRPHHLEGVGVERLDGRRTLAFVGGLVGGAAAALLAARSFGGDSENPKEGDGGDEPEAMLRLRIPISFGIRR